MDPNSSAMALIEAAAHHGRGGRGAAAIAAAFDVESMYGDGHNLYEYLSSSPWSRYDPMGLAQDPFDMVDEYIAEWTGSIGGFINQLIGAAKAAAFVGAMVLSMAPFPVAAIAGEIGMKILEGEVPPELQMAAKVMGYATMGAMIGMVGKIGYNAIKSAVHYIRKYGIIGSVRRAWGALTGRAKTWSDEKDKIPGACCFTAGTLVWTLVGLAPIESIRVGDIVLAHDTATGESRYQVVTRAFEVTSASVLEVRMLGDAGEESFETSSEHPFHVEGQGWTRADQLRPGDAVRTLSGATRIAVVESVRFTGRRAPVYDLTVDGDHTFHVGVGGVVVHNCETADLGRKLEYLFGNASGNVHNVTRSTDLGRQLNRIGIFDNERGRRILTEHLSLTYNNLSSILSREGNKTVRESLLAGPRGFLKMESIWDGNKLVTVYLYGG